MEEQTKVVKLCKEGSCCPEVRVEVNRVVIGEDENICTLTKEQWDILKDKIISREL